jgi:hypothetical protein
MVIERLKKLVPRMIRTSFFIAMAVMASVAGLGAQDTAPFRVGEEMEFTIRALGLDAAWQKVRVAGMTNISGRTAYKITSIICTYPLVETVYKMRDKSWTCLDIHDFNSLLTVSVSTEGKWNNAAFISNVVDESRIRYVDLRKGTFFLPYALPLVDLIGMVYHGRTLTLGTGRRYRFSIIYYAQVKRVEAKFAGLDRKNVGPLKKRNLELCRIEQMGDSDVAFWLTSDERRIPVRIRTMKIRLAGIYLGNIESVLIKYTPGP